MASEASLLALLAPSIAQCPAGVAQKDARGCAEGSEEVLRIFGAAHAGSVSLQFGQVAAMRYSSGSGFSRMQFASLDDVFCVFIGSLDNLCQLRHTYGLAKSRCSEAGLIIEMYKALRDRAPFPMSQALADFSGAFSFVLFDQRDKAVVAAVDVQGRHPLYWGTCQDGALALSDDVDLLRQGCGTSFAPFPAGCFFCSSAGLKSFEHPDQGLRAVPHVDAKTGNVCGMGFVVDPMMHLEPRAHHVGSHHDLTAFTM